MIEQTAFIGLGRMGLPMAKRLQASSGSLVTFDADIRARESAAGEGLVVASSLNEAIDGADVVYTSLPSASTLLDVMSGPNGVLECVGAGSVVVDLSTSPPETARRLACEAARRQVHVLDAPVSGGPPRAIDGTLTIMVGGDADAYRAVSPHLALLGERVLHMGSPGAGQATKLCNNLLAGVVMTAVAEAVALAEAEQLNPAQLFEVLTTSTGDSSVLRRRFPVPGIVPTAPVNDGFAPQFPISLMQKDLDLAIDAASAYNIELPITACARERYEQAVRNGLAELDYSAVNQLYTLKGSLPQGE